MACNRRAGRVHRLAQVHEQLVFQVLGFLVGREDLLLVLFQLGRDVAFGVLERLLADVVGRHLSVAVAVRLDVVAEDFVVADFQLGDSRPLDLLGLVAGNPLFAARRQFAVAGPVPRESRRG